MLKAGKDMLILGLQQRDGYTYRRAKKIVNAFVAILKKALGQHKRVELEGIGRIYISKRRNAKVRYAEKNLKHVGPTIVTRHPKKYEIRFKRAAHWEKEDE